MNIHQILIKYWGHNTFRPLQEDIINSVLNGEDTLALMPTGGGKSICFQVPGLAKSGVCIVISPLIALMKDQVNNLNKRGIKAVAIFSGMHYNQIDIALDNCVHGDVKFLYLSPERLLSDVVRLRLKKMNVNLIAVDEAHCISQWGYDFRPPYLKIADIRGLFQGVPILALTATATPEVIDDIQNKLLFKNKNVFRKSFERKNLVYAVIKEEDKFNRLLRIIFKVNGSGIVYVRNRRKTREIAEFLVKNNISADYYHAGLDTKTRDVRQNAWMNNSKRVIVSTNAFGMGIDKSDVRFVVHFDLPDTLEAYFQEAGRAGRDEKKSYAILMFCNADILDARHNLENAFPSIEEIKNTYQCLGNFYNLAVGSGKDASFNFDINKFCESYNLKPYTVYNCLKFLEKDGYISNTDSMFQSSVLHINVDKENLYRFQIENKNIDNFIKTILRSYGGVFNDFVKVNETEIASRSGTTKEKTIEILSQLNKLGILTYVPQKDTPQIIYCGERIDSKDLNISKGNYHERKIIAQKKLDSVINFATSITKCRSQLLLMYFEENEAKRCGQCDVCIERNKIDLSEIELDTVINYVKPLLLNESYTLEETVGFIKGVSENKIIKAIQWLIDNEKIRVDEEQKLSWKKREV
ncbi:MAG: RecQ family ATP-dependent DNA helicase [Bacteroidetes bacterium]|nr:RecQ family ATP-dependent DNA helicase [Bacteroidota bacterium]